MGLKVYHFILQVPFISNPVLDDKQLSENQGVVSMHLNLAL